MTATVPSTQARAALSNNGRRHPTAPSNARGLRQMEPSLRRPPRSLSSRALSDTGNTRAAARNGSENGDRALKPERANSSRTDKEALQAALLRHRTLELQARLRAGSPLGADAGSAAGLGSNGATASSRLDALPMPSSFPGGTSRPPLPGVTAAGRAVAPGARGSAHLTPEEELRGCLCGGAGSAHRPRTFTVVDWVDRWNEDMRCAFVAAGTALWGGRKSGKDAATAADADAAEPGTPQQQEAPALVPMVAMAR